MNEPANIKNGIAIKENESIAVNILWTTIIRGIFIIVQVTTAADNPNATPIGAPISNKVAKLMNIIHSNNIIPPQFLYLFSI